MILSKHRLQAFDFRDLRVLPWHFNSIADVQCTLRNITDPGLGNIQLAKHISASHSRKDGEVNRKTHIHNSPLKTNQNSLYNKKKHIQPTRKFISRR